MSAQPQDLLNELKTKLEAKKLAFEKELALLTAEDSYQDLSRADGNSEDADEAYEDLAHEESQIKLSELNKSLGRVEKALSRLATGDYGKCEVCSAQIDAARLKVYPEASTCIEHAA
uniref:Zinc finger DksA/TraR C4-type domain-containing protein n=1 Tax=candidate division WWE3 bacterium TaxID=2053526 RepID=A0A7C4TJG0_UNCKA